MAKERQVETVSPVAKRPTSGIRKLRKEGENIKVILEFTLDGRNFKSLMHARSFIVKHQKKMESLINKYAFAAQKLGFIEISSPENKKVVDALRRLGLLSQG